MKKTLVALASLALIGTAFAGNDNSNGGCQGNCPSAGGATTVTANPSSTASAGAIAGAAAIATGTGGTAYGGAGGTGGAGGNSTAFGGAGGSVLGSGNSSVRNDNANIGVNSQGQHQGQGQSQSASSNQSQSNSSSNSVSGANTNGATGSGNVTSIDVAAPVIPKPAAMTAYAPEVPTIAKSCRLFLGAGGTTRDGSASGVIPLWKDQECVSVTAVQLMMEVNRGQRAMGQEAAFKVDDVLAMACKIEGMETLSACKK